MSQFDIIYSEICSEMGYSFDEIEACIRRKANMQSNALRYAQLVEQEIDLEQQLLEEYPELTPFVHALNTQEIAASTQGVTSKMGGEQKKMNGKRINLFPGLSL